MSAFPAILEQFFQLEEHNSDVVTELRAGVVTFFTSSYIIFVQPAVLSSAGMDFGAVMTATCLASAIGCQIMGLWANYPIALAPGMGINFYFTYTVVLGQGIPWEIALGAVFLSGVILILLTIFRFRGLIINIIPDYLKNGIAAGIGIFITFIGFVQGGWVLDHSGTLVQLGDLKSLPAVFTLVGVVTIGVLLQREVTGAIFIGMLVVSLLGIPFGLVEFSGVISSPPDLTPTLLKMDLTGALDLGVLTIIGVFVFVDLFDTAGTLIGVGQQGGFVKYGKLPRVNRALMPDAVATTAGAAFGTSTVTCYIESSTGIAEGGRTGLTSVVTACLFLSALFFAPLVRMIGGGYVLGETTFYPITAPVLIIVGCLMARNLVHINWRQWDEALPSYLIVVGMPLTFSIADGMALGFISYPLIKLFCGKAREVHWCIYLIAILFVFRYSVS